MIEMDIDEARQVLHKVIYEDGSLYNLGWYIEWLPYGDKSQCTLDGEFTIEQLEAIVVYMKYMMDK